MKKITILGFLAMIAVLSAFCGCEPVSFCGPIRTKNLNEASDRNGMAGSRPLDAPVRIKMKEVECSLTERQDFLSVPTSSVKSLVHKFEAKATGLSTQGKPRISKKMLYLIQRYQPPVASPHIRTSVLRAKNTIPAISAQQMPSTPAQQTQNRPTVPLNKVATPVRTKMVESQVPETESKATILSTQSKLSVSEKMSSLIQNYQPPVMISQVGTSVSTTKDTMQVTSAHQMPSTPAQKSQDRPADPNQASAQEQVLVLNVPQELKPRFQKLDENWFLRLICGDGTVVRAHKSILNECSPFLRNYEGNSVELNYPANIIKSLLKLMYDKSVTIYKADYDKTMEAANILQMNNLISVLQDNVVHLSYRR